jgi:hypothetical protein
MPLPLMIKIYKLQYQNLSDNNALEYFDKNIFIVRHI